MAADRRSALLDNPIIRYEAVPKLLRRLPPRELAGVLGGSSLLGIPIGFLVVAAVPDLASLFGYLVISLWAGLTVLVSAIQLASSIVQERQKRTWDALVLTRLRPADIVVGKLLGTLLPLWVLGLMLLPLSLVLTAASTGSHDMSVGAVLLIFVGSVVASASCSSLALYCSMCCATVGTAQLLTFGLLFGLNQVGGMITMLLGLLLSTLEDPAVQGSFWILGGTSIACYVLLQFGPGFFFGWRLVTAFHHLDRRYRK